jgi:hypothetical protein
MKEYMVVMKEPEKSQQFRVASLTPLLGFFRTTCKLPTGLMVFEKTAGAEGQTVKTSFVIYTSVVLGSGFGDTRRFLVSSMVSFKDFVM